MFYVDHCVLTKSASEQTYTFDSELRRECEDIMARIYKEEPSYWPEGLNISGHHDLYMIREASTKKAVGFTGWQEFVKEGGKKVGYYTIGILPEYRHNGFAKEAVRKLIAKKANSVDRVEAFIAPHNQPSLNLAARLGIGVIKSAHTMPNSSAAKWILGSGIGNAAAWDYLGQGDKQPWQKDYWQDNSRDRVMMGGLNALLGMGGGYLMGKGFHGLQHPSSGGGAGGSIAEGAGLVALSPVKDWLVRSLPAAAKLPGLADNLSKSPEQQESVVSWLKNMSPTAKAIGLGAAGLGALGLAYTAHKGINAVGDLAESNKALAGGRLQVTLPSKDKYDHETVVNMPINDINVSDRQKDKLTRDVRRRIYRETKERTRHRKPVTETTPEDEEKAACLMPVRSSSMDNLKALIDHIYHGH